MKKIIRLLNEAVYGILVFTLVISTFTFITAIPWAFIHIEIGRFTEPHLSLIFSILILASIIICIPIIIQTILTKHKKNTAKSKILTNFIFAFLIILLLSSLFALRVSDASQKIEAFITQNKNLDFYEYVEAVSSFLNRNVKNAYRKPEAIFRIDNDIYSSLLGAYLTQQLGLTRASIIVYQGWGTCGQAAILIEELLARAGYETRQAHFKNIDHAWAEAKYNGTWLIIDPWYIGNLIEIQNLKTLRQEFQNATGVIVQYRNGTTTDASQEHGYYP
ncbi:MAG: transglutaminase domain-containing protein [Candidatus Bathyarchaeia archaeon]